MSVFAVHPSIVANALASSCAELASDLAVIRTLDRLNRDADAYRKDALEAVAHIQSELAAIESALRDDEAAGLPTTTRKAA